MEEKKDLTNNSELKIIDSNHMTDFDIIPSDVCLLAFNCNYDISPDIKHPVNQFFWDQSDDSVSSKLLSIESILCKLLNQDYNQNLKKLHHAMKKIKNTMLSSQQYYLYHLLNKHFFSQSHTTPPLHSTSKTCLSISPKNIKPTSPKPITPTSPKPIKHTSPGGPSSHKPRDRPSSHKPRGGPKAKDSILNVNDRKEIKKIKNIHKRFFKDIILTMHKIVQIENNNK